MCVFKGVVQIRSRQPVSRAPPGQSWASRNANKRGPRLALPGLGGGIPELFTQSSNGKHEIEGTEVAPSDPDRFGDTHIYM